ncbi:MAG: hypothetical protein WCT85_02255 [Parachlamydiales bacterium]|jgi:hypothetical protein
MTFIYDLASALFGFFVGFLYFGSLLLQVKKLYKFKSSFMLIFGFIIRYVLSGISIFLILKFAQPRQIILFFLAFLIVMISMILYQYLKKRKKSYEN